VVDERSLHYESGFDFEKYRGKCELICDIKITISKIRHVNRGANCQIVILNLDLQLGTHLFCHSPF